MMAKKILIVLSLLLISSISNATSFNCEHSYYKMHGFSKHIGKSNFKDRYGYNEINLGFGLGCSDFLATDNIKFDSEIGFYKNSFGKNSSYVSSKIYTLNNFYFLDNTGIKFYLANNYGLNEFKYSAKYEKFFYERRKNITLGVSVDTDMRISKDASINYNFGKSNNLYLLTMSLKYF